jgi:hypothetical protein
MLSKHLKWFSLNYKGWISLVFLIIQFWFIKKKGLYPVNSSNLMFVNFKEPICNFW